MCDIDDKLYIYHLWDTDGIVKVKEEVGEEEKNAQKDRLQSCRHCLTFLKPIAILSSLLFNFF